MELQSQHGPGGSLVVIQQPSLESRQRSDYERELQHAAILSLEQIKAIRSSNEYTEGPSVARRPPAPRMAPRPQDKQERTHEVILVNVNNNYERRPPGLQHHHVGVVAGSGGPRAPGLSRSTSTGSAASSGSNSSASSEQGLLARSPPTRPVGVSLANQHRPVRTQPKPKALLPQPQQGLHFHQPPLEAPLKPHHGKGKSDFSTGSGLDAAAAAGHQFICERCGKCKCGECTAPRSLPSCLACNGQCLCSAESALEHGTCMCLVKGIFYHCSNDDEGDSSADHPCSLSRSHCCSRFLCMGLMSVLFPCLLCYPPVKGCLKACTACHDRVNRPGCRCKNSNTVYCKLESWASQAQEKPS
ncbi:protein sprouty homolog 1 [Cololabis saira]|uniref:protein sprouty homolog 1 n=1 Tax=Cololabis saira TaxID=129043 RepID=UPI002AD40A4F|nr:protein sprouty homolog 1 [Cololabis saira]